MNDASREERYARTRRIAEIGEAGQAQLHASSVLVIGAGGLGSPALLYLAAAGVGHLTVMDGDAVEASNLNRQILHDPADIGKPKAASACETLQRFAPEGEMTALPCRFGPEHGAAFLQTFDIVLDCTDNFESRYAIADACRDAGLALVIATVVRLEGQIFAITPSPDVPCLRCLFPHPPTTDEAPQPADVGVLGAAAGVLGSLQAAEAIKILLGIGEPLTHHLLSYDGWTGRFIRLERRKRQNCPCHTPSPL